MCCLCAGCQTPHQSYIHVLLWIALACKAERELGDGLFLPLCLVWCNAHVLVSTHITTSQRCERSKSERSPAVGNRTAAL